MRSAGSSGVVWGVRIDWGEELPKPLKGNGPSRTCEVRGDRWAPETVDLCTPSRT